MAQVTISAAMPDLVSTYDRDTGTSRIEVNGVTVELQGLPPGTAVSVVDSQSGGLMLSTFA